MSHRYLRTEPAVSLGSISAALSSPTGAHSLEQRLVTEPTVSLALLGHKTLKDTFALSGNLKIMAQVC